MAGADSFARLADVRRQLLVLLRSMASNTTQLYEIHGLLVESELPLEAREVTPGSRPPGAEDARPDYRILQGESRQIPMAPPPGRLLGEHRKLEFGYWSSEEPERGAWLFRYGGVCDAVIDHSRNLITVHPDPGADPGLVSITAGGGVLAHALVAKGRLLIHACAVEIDGRAVAITGDTGSGKSTVAALLCAAGARLVADDALFCEVGPTGVTCYPGNTVLRLRPGAAELAAQIPDAQVSSSVDGRVAVRPPLVEGAAELKAVLIPVPSHDATRLEVERLDGMEGLIELIRNPRPNAWTDPELIGRLFDRTAEAAKSLAVIRATVPWGPPFPGGLAEELLRAVGLRARPRVARRDDSCAPADYA